MRIYIEELGEQWALDVLKGVNCNEFDARTWVHRSFERDDGISEQMVYNEYTASCIGKDHDLKIICTIKDSFICPKCELCIEMKNSECELELSRSFNSMTYDGRELYIISSPDGVHISKRADR